MFDAKEREGSKRRHQVDTIVSLLPLFSLHASPRAALLTLLLPMYMCVQVEGIGINRLTHNFNLGQSLITDAFRTTDQEAIAMSRHLVHSDGLFIGSSSACNLVACVRLAKTMPKGSTIVTVLCDSGVRHQSKVGHFF